jgi:hypothetical protein
MTKYVVESSWHKNRHLSAKNVEETYCYPLRLSYHRHLALVGLLALFLLLATVYNAISTPFEAPDEIGHLSMGKRRLGPHHAL